MEKIIEPLTECFFRIFLYHHDPYIFPINVCILPIKYVFFPKRYEFFHDFNYLRFYFIHNTFHLAHNPFVYTAPSWLNWHVYLLSSLNIRDVEQHKRQCQMRTPSYWNSLTMEYCGTTFMLVTDDWFAIDRRSRINVVLSVVQRPY